MRRVLVPTAAALLLAAVPAGAKTTWLCRPGLARNPCTPNLSTTLYRGWDQRVGVVHPQRVRSPRIDCFYVYPTVSDQEGPNATRSIDPELRSVALFEASRYSQYCRMYAPVYRQITVPALNGGKVTPAAAKIAYDDFHAAWRDYLAHHNHGRPFVLIGHSQGAGDLQRLVRDEIDRSSPLRRRMLSAILLGGNVTRFRNVPACRGASQLHCVIAFSTYNETPPSDSIFGRSARGPVLCTNPAALGGGSADLDSIAPTQPFAPNTLIALGVQLLGFEYPKASTTYLESRGAFSGRCVRENGATVLRVRSLGNTPVPKPSPTAQWGLHLMDANIALGDLVRVVRAQSRAFARRPGA